MNLSIERPKQSWEQYIASLSPSKPVSLGGICERWNEYDLIERKDEHGKVVAHDRRSRENGEQRAYMAWATGAMEPEEERVFSMMSLRLEPLVLLAIVPAVRELISRSDRDAKLLVDALKRIAALESAGGAQ